MDRPCSLVDQRRLFAAAVAASIVLHALALALWPGTGSVRRDEAPRVVEVRLRPAVIASADQAEAEIVPTPVRAAPADMRRTLPAPRPAPSTPAPEHDAVPVLPLSERALDGPSSPLGEPSRDPAAVEGGSPSTAVSPSQAVTPGRAEGTAAGTADRLSVAYLHAPPPRYPLSARRAGESGNVALKVLVGADGSARHVEIENSSGSRALDLAAREAVQGWQFVPARRGTDAVDAWVVIQVVFRLERRE